MVEANIVLTLLQTISIMVGIGYYILNIQNNQKNQQMQLQTRQAQLFMQIHNKWSNIEYKTAARKLLQWDFNDSNDYLEKYAGPEKVEYEGSIAAINTYLEGVGVLIERELIDVSLARAQEVQQFGLYLESSDMLSQPCIELW